MTTTSIRMMAGFRLRESPHFGVMGRTILSVGTSSCSGCSAFLFFVLIHTHENLASNQSLFRGAGGCTHVFACHSHVTID